MADPILFSNTQRIVIFIDLYPLAIISDPSLYFTPIISSVRTLISFPHLSSSLFAFKFFFSSLSPLLSSSKLHPLLGKSAFSLSFHDHTQALSFLSQIPNFFSALSPPDCFFGLPISPPRVEFAAKSICQLIHDYPWEKVASDPMNDEFDLLVRQNLVLVFSHVPSSERCLSMYMDTFPGDVQDGIRVSERLKTSLGHVREAFVCRDIHCCWVDVGCTIDCCNNDGIKLGHFRGGISGLGWGFCSTETIVLGSSLVPFGLIYTLIGVLPSFLASTCHKEVVHGQLDLQILDVNNNPLVCKCCDLDLVSVGPARSIIDYTDDIPLDQYLNLEKMGTSRNCKRIWEHGNSVRIHVKGVEKLGTSIRGRSPDAIVGCALSSKDRKLCGVSNASFFTDKVFEILFSDMDGFLEKKPVPIWHIFLSFLYRQGYCAVVSLRIEGGDFCMGVLVPFTFVYALVYISDDIVKSSVSAGHQNELSFPCGDKAKDMRKQSYPIDINWSTFYAEAFNGTRMFLEEIYFTKDNMKSKKLKFLKCWMKQSRKHISKQSVVKNETFCEGMENRVIPKEFERSFSSIASSGDDLVGGSLEIEGVSPIFSQQEECEAFFGDLPEKIRLGLESKGVDLGALAERLVSLSILFLQDKQKHDEIVGKEEPLMGCDNIIVESMKHLLLETKDLAVKCSILNEGSNPASHTPNSDLIVRIYELQILFRMELLRSNVAAVFMDSMKQKFVKQICSFLETIQYHLEGGFFGDTSIEDYMEVKIRNRYTITLGDVVERIYKKMDILDFGEDDDDVASDCDQSSRGRAAELGEEEESVSAEKECSGESHPGTAYGAEYACQLASAREKRDEARRSASFTSWMPDLQRVWALKQIKTGAAGNPRRKRKRAYGGSRDRVRETPVSGMKQSGCCRNAGSASSVSKALFQEEL